MSLPDYYQRANPDLLRLMPADARVVVEVGCGAGALCKEYRRFNPFVRYCGIELNPEAAQVAEQRLNRVVVADVERTEAADLELEPGTVDCLIYGDVLEHLVDPWAVVRKQAAWLRPGGQVVACIPNVQHWSMIFNLLRGDWKYQDEGLLDRTHLRFFTLETMQEMFIQAGMQIHDVQSRVFPSPHYPLFQKAIAPAVQALNLNWEQLDSRAQALQYVIRAVKSAVPPRRLLVQTLLLEPICGPVRILEAERFLNTIPGVRTYSVGNGAQVNMAVPEPDKVFIWQRACFGRETLNYQKQLLRNNFLIVAEFDDDPDHFPKHRENEYMTFRSCHCIQTSTEPLATEVRKHNPNVAVFENQVYELPPPRTYADTGVIKLFFGALNRQPDWDPLMPALNRVLAAYGNQVRVRIIWDFAFYFALQTPYKDYEGLCPYPRYLELLRECDIAFLPLNPTRFNSLKSDLKFIECAANGVAVVASPTIYEKCVRHEETGLLFRSEAEFEAQLHRLIADRALRQRLASNAYQDIARSRLLSQHYRRRYDWYLTMRDQLPQLNAQLRQRVPELFAT